MSAIVHTYKELHIINVFIGYKNACSIKSEYKKHTRGVINKMACFYPCPTSNLISDLYSATTPTSFSPGAKLFVASECKTQRDIFRNSGYTIKLNPSDADVIVVPDVIPSQYYYRQCNLVATDQNEEYLFLINIQKSGYSIYEDITESDIENVKNYLIGLRNYKIDDASCNLCTVWFIPKCDKLKEVMMEAKSHPLTPYVQEHLVPIKPSTTFSPETLLYWKNIAKQDQELLARTICTSDWRKYPFTLLAFLKTNGEKAWNLVGNSDFRNILNNIRYSQYGSIDGDLNNRTVSPADYNMFQSYLYYLMGIDEEKGGVVDIRTIESNVTRSLLEYLQKRMVFKPLQLSGAMNAKSLKELVK